MEFDIASKPFWIVSDSRTIRRDVLDDASHMEVLTTSGEIAKRVEFLIRKNGYSDSGWQLDSKATRTLENSFLTSAFGEYFVVSECKELTDYLSDNKFEAVDSHFYNPSEDLEPYPNLRRIVGRRLKIRR